MLAVDLRGQYVAVAAVLPELLARPRALILSVSSVAALKPAAGRAHYAASKAGALAFFRALAEELRHRGVRGPGAAAQSKATPGLRARRPPGFAFAGYDPPEVFAGVIRAALAGLGGELAGAIVEVDGDGQWRRSTRLPGTRHTDTRDATIRRCLRSPAEARLGRRGWGRCWSWASTTATTTPRRCWWRTAGSSSRSSTSRVSRTKRAKFQLPAESVLACLEVTGRTAADIDLIACGWNDDTLAGLADSDVRYALDNVLPGAFSRLPALPPLVGVQHHLAHAASAFWCSGYGEARSWSPTVRATTRPPRCGGARRPGWSSWPASRLRSPSGTSTSRRPSTSGWRWTAATTRAS